MGLLTLARWLGPWADTTTSPDVFTRDDELRRIPVRVYESNDVRSTSRVVIAPGLHYAGPDDPRMDRFCRVLAASGHQVIAPFVPSYLALVPDENAKRDFIEVVDEVTRQTNEDLGKPIVFSISFGSLLAFALAAERPELVDRLIIFGGYADFHETMRFCLTGQVASGRQAARDPLNQCVVMLNLLSYIDHERALSAALVAGWNAYVRRTWGRPELKAQERFVPIAEELAAQIPEPVRELFLIGVGAREGTWDLALPALQRFDATALDPSPYLPRVRCRVDLVHGADDDVIPFEQSNALGQRLVNADARVHVTGLYGHTGAQRPRPAALVRELATMVRVLRSLAG